MSARRAPHLALGRAQHALTDADWNLVNEMVFAVESRWVEPDHGIWEIPGNPRHHVYSKVTCWSTMGRALKLVAAAGPTGLLSEKYDPVAERALGNHPQAYSHIGLPRSAQLLDA